MSSTTFDERPHSRGPGKLRLLICKNVSVLLAHPFGMAIILLAPILSFLCTQFGQIFDVGSPVNIKETKFKPVEILSPNATTIFYSPINIVLGRVVKDVAQSLGTKQVKPFLYASDLGAALAKQDAFVGIEFEDKLRTIIEIPSKIKVALRFPYHLRNSVYKTWPIRSFKPLVSMREKSVYDTEGFLKIQDLLFGALIKEKNHTAYVPLITMQPFPEKAHSNYSYLRKFFNNFITYFLCIFMGPSIIIGQKIVAEKQRQIREIVRLMGLSVGLNWLSWFIVSFLLLVIPTLFLVILIKSYLCPSSSYAVLLLIFIVFLLALIWFTFLVCTCVSNTALAITVLLIGHCASSLPFIVMGQDASRTEAIVMSLYVNSAMPLILYQILGFELRGVGVQWKNLFQCCHPDDHLSIGLILFIMLGMTLCCMILCLYIDQLNPGPFGVAKKWYFPITRKFWCPWKRRRSFTDEEVGLDTSMPEYRNEGAYEQVLNNNEVIIEAQKLNKKYDDQYVVRDFSLKFYEDEITILLGHNGSGKTTICMMLAGIFSPTSGRVLINGRETYRGKAGESLSICPQKNILFEELSAYWHIVFYSRLKGFKKSEAKEEAYRYLEVMDLMDKASIKVEYLTADMRRKLSLCCALCADTKIVLCDEPTACLDPSARREVWNLLRSEKTGRCIIMTTHFMEAAEVLGDRIAILCEGQLYGYGTAEFIVKNLGPGYCLVCVMLPDCNVDEVTNFLTRRMQNIELERTDDVNIIYRLPIDQVQKFTSLFRALESRLGQLRLSSFGVSAPTLGETFVKIGVDKVGQKRSPGATAFWVADAAEKKVSRTLERFRNDWHAMMLKKILFTRHHKFFNVLIIILPLIGIVVLLLLGMLSNHAENFEIDPGDLSMYPNPVVVKNFAHNEVKSTEIFYDYSNEFARKYEAVAMYAGAKVVSTGKLAVDNYLLENIDVDKEGFTETYVAAASLREGAIIAWFNRRLEHGAPLSIRLVHGAIAQSLAHMQIAITNKPRTDSHLTDVVDDNDMSAIKRCLFVVLYLCFAISLAILQPVHERATQMKLQQMLSGVSLWTYWLSHLLWDYLMYLLTALAMLAACYKEPVHVIKWLSVVLIIFGFSALAFTYLFSCLFNDPGTGMSYMVVVNCCIVFVAFYMHPHMDEEAHKYFHYIFMILPFYTLYQCCLIIFENDREMGNCQDLSSVCNLGHTHGGIYTISLTNELICLAITGLLFLTLLMLSPYLLLMRYSIKFFLVGLKTRRSIFRRLNMFCSRSSRGFMVRGSSDQSEDDYVRLVRQQIDRLAKDEQQLKACSLVCNRVSKKYRRVLAVNSVSLKILPYECFGLLGLHGAGKTSLIRMIVGELMISRGDVFVRGYSVKKQLKTYYQHIGYCPQRSTMLNYLTGRQLLKFICLSSGIKRQNISDIIDNLAESFVLTETLDRQIKYYSAGMKRKLNIAMAVLSRPLVCLDEPTMGVDISAKQEIWLVLRDMRNLGRSILLTSHNMQECEALCSCAAVMVNGTLRCYGSVHQLKSRYKKGITIKIQLALTSELSDIRSLNEWESHRSPRSSRSIKDLDNRSQAPIGGTDSERSISKDEANAKGTQAHIRKTVKPKGTPSRQVKSTTKLPPVPVEKSSHLHIESFVMGSGSFNLLTMSEYWRLINFVQKQFQLDFPDSYIEEKIVTRGMLTIVIPDIELKWSTIFRYLEEHRKKLQIKHYAISETSLEDIFMNFALDQTEEQ